MEVEGDNVTIGHEATVSKIGDEQVFNLTSRGIPEAAAAAMVLRGSHEPPPSEPP